MEKYACWSVRLSMLKVKKKVKRTHLLVDQTCFIVVECKQSALIEETGKKRVKTAKNDKPEVAPRDGAMKTQISGP